MAGADGVLLRWHFGADSIGQDEGWAIDNIVISDDVDAPAIAFTQLNDTFSKAMS